MLTACGGSSAADKQYNKDNASTDLETAMQERKLDEEGKQQVRDYVDVAANIGAAEMLEGKTYGEIVDAAMKSTPVDEESVVPTTEEEVNASDSLSADSLSEEGQSTQ